MRRAPDTCLAWALLTFLLLAMLCPQRDALAQGRPAVSGSPARTADALLKMAPGYCESFGGSLSYESISNVVVTQGPDSSLIIKVDVWIANPSGCVAGEPCPTYDQSPEYVNAWIDFNGDGKWTADERVMDAELTGYRNINYRGTMHTESITKVPPDAKRPTWMRVNLGYGHDPNDPCEQTWSYGNVWDKEVLSSVKIAELWSQGDVPIRDVQNPVWKGSYDKHGVFLSASANEPAAWPMQFGKFSFQVFLQSFPAGIDLVPKVVCEYEFTSSHSSLRSTTDPFTGWSGTIFGTLPRQIGKYNLKLRFKIHDNDNRLISTQTVELPVVYITYGIPAVLNPRLVVPKRLWYDKAMEWVGGLSDPEKIAQQMMEKVYAFGSGWVYRNVRTPWDGLLEGSYDRGSCRSMTDIWLNLMRTLGVPGTTVFEDAGAFQRGFVSKPGLRAFDGTVGYGRETFYYIPGAGGPDRWVWSLHYYGKLGGRFYDPTLNMSRSVSDRGALVEWEKTGTMDNGLVNILDGRDFEWVKGPAGCARLIETLDRSGTDAGAWNNSLYDITDCTPGLPRIFGPVGLQAAHFTGTSSEQPVDTDGDGLANVLECVVQVDNVEGRSFLVQGSLWKGDAVITLRDSLTSIAAPLYTVPPVVGIGSVRLLFSGEDIRRGVSDGPYRIRLLLLDTSAVLLDTLSVTTAAYGPGQFGEVGSRLSQATEQAVDVNGDGKFDFLDAAAGLDISGAGRYWVEASLSAAGGVIASGGHQVEGSPGAAIATVRISGREISASGADGPYQLDIVVMDSSMQYLHHISTTTRPYLAGDFQAARARLSGVYTDRGVDTSGNGLFDFLQLELGLTVDSASGYQVAAWLQDDQGNEVASGRWSGNLAAGMHTVPVDFPGQEIHRTGKDQAYTLSYVMVSDQNAPLLAWKRNADTTNVYSFASFEPSRGTLVSLTGQNADHGVDSDGDGLFDSLAIDIGVTVADSGVVWALGRLVDDAGNELAVASTPLLAAPGTSATALLLFDGRRIYGSRTNGPYLVKNLHVYHAGAPEDEVVVEDAHATATYQYTAFEKAGIVTGTVTDSLGTALAGVLVFMPGGDVQYTGAGGTYHLVALRDSTYTVKVRGPEGVTGDWSISVGGQLAGRGDSIQVPIRIGEVSQVDFRASVVAPVWVGRQDRPLIRDYWMYQNYPNPFNPSTVIEYDLPRMSQVRLSIFDPVGREVALLVDGQVEAGRHQVRFNAAGLASGLYFFRLQAGEYTSIKKMLVVK